MAECTKTEDAVALAIIHEVMMDAGTPLVTNALDMLTPRNRARVYAQARAAIAAYEKASLSTTKEETPS